MLNSAIPKTWVSLESVTQFEKMNIFWNISLNTSAWLLKYFGKQHSKLACLGRKVGSLHLFTDWLCHGWCWTGSVKGICLQEHYIVVTWLPHMLRLIFSSLADLSIAERAISSASALPIQYVFLGSSAPLQWSYFVTFCLLRLWLS